MEILTRALDTFFSFKAYVMLPIVILILGLLIRMKVWDALLSALKVAVGFAGIFIVFNFFVSNIGPAVEAFVSKRGLDFPVLDVGWPPLAAITWASKIAPVSIPLVIVINLIMLASNTTKTINIDVWNYWHFALVGALLHQTTGNFFLGLAATALIAVFSIKMADWSTPFVKRDGGLEGIAITTLSVNGLVPLGIVADQVIEKIPGLRRINWNPAEQKKGLAILSEPMIIGVAIGVFLGLLAGYPARRILELCVHIAAVMFILPHCGTLIGQGMQPFSLKLKSSIQTVFPKKTDLNVGMDSGVLMGNPSVIVTGLVLMPVSLALAFVIPGNRSIPLGDLANLISVMSLIVLSMRGNVFRALLVGLPIVISYLLIATVLAPLFTTLSARAGAVMEGGYGGLITAFTDGGNPIRYWFYHMFRGNWIALLVILPTALLGYLTWRKYRRMIDQGE
ncbi:MAG: PTS galactitol transporter subunit IIC [Spirochaetaceae bacterium]|nr:MAG: PTS galactitol transporter subunit IIC [Spirochaetaceae bacterium]